MNEEQVKYSQRLEIRLSVNEMETLDRMSKDREIGKSEYIRALIEKEKSAHETGQLMNNFVIARAATSWTAVFPDRKEVDKKTAKTCRAAMSIARNENKTPEEALPAACKINGTDIENILEIINELTADWVSD